METSFDTFPVFQPQKPLQIIPYNGPPEPKQSSRRYPSKKAPFSKDEYYDVNEILGIEPRSNTQRNNRGHLAPTLHRVKVMALTCLDEVNLQISGVGGGSGDVGSDHRFFSQNERESVGFQQNVSMRTSPKGIRDESTNQPAPSEGTSQENAVVIEDSQPELGTNDGCPREDDIDTRTGDQLEIPTISTPERCGGECSIGAEDAINPDAVDRTRASRLPRREFTSTPPTSSTMMNIEQPTPEASGHTILKATTHQLQRPMQKKADRQGKFPTLESTSNSSGTDDDDDYDSVNHTTWLIRKRKRSSSAKRHSRTSNTTSSDDSTKESGDRGRHLGSNKRQMSTACPYRRHRHKRKGNRGITDKDDEYEVEKILDARVNRGKLQYHVKWLGYEDDPVWYDATNFKNSPHKLHDFHAANHPPRASKKA